MGYGVKKILPSPPNYVTRSPGLDSRTRTRTSTRFDCPFFSENTQKIYNPVLLVSSIGSSVILTFWSKNDKTATVFLICFDTTTFSKNLELKWRWYHVFADKMALVCARSMLSYEKISKGPLYIGQLCNEVRVRSLKRQLGSKVTYKPHARRKWCSSHAPSWRWFARNRQESWPKWENEGNELVLIHSTYLRTFFFFSQIHIHAIQIL